jgi:hypothetical protein
MSPNTRDTRLTKYYHQRIRCVLRGLFEASARGHGICWIVVAGLATWTSSVAYADGGVVAGGLRIHPSLTVDSGYDSNVYLMSTDEEPISALRFDITPALRVRQVAPITTDFRLDAMVNWRQFANYSADDARDQSGLFANIGVESRFNPRGFVSFLARNRFSRSIEPWLDSSGDPFQVLRNEARAEVAFHRGGYTRDGRSGVTGQVGLRHHVALYERFDQLDRQRLGADAEVRWHFLPKTALFLDGTVESLRFTNEQDPLAQSFANADGLPWSLGGGLAGLVLPRLGFNLRLGYGDTNREVGASVGGLVARAGVDVYLDPTQKLSLYYNRDFADAVQGNFVRFHRVMASYDARGRLLEFGLAAYYQRSAFGRISDTLVEGESVLSTRDRTDDVVGARTSLGFVVGPVMVVGVTYGVDFRDSNFLATALSDRVFLDPRYVRHVAQLSLTVRY